MSRRRCKRGQHNRALGRLRDGCSCKVHFETDFDGLPIGFHLTGGEFSDSTQFKIALDLVRHQAARGDDGQRL